MKKEIEQTKTLKKISKIKIMRLKNLKMRMEN